MTSRSNRTKNIAAGTSARVERISGWERSSFSTADLRKLKKMGLLTNGELTRIPGDEAVPNPPEDFRVTFSDFLLRGFSTPVHEFLRGLLFVYVIQLFQLTPNSLLHISIFVTLCECFLGVHPHWGLWKRIFYLRRNNSGSAIYNVGGVCICVRPEVGYFDLKFPDSVQGWRKKWLYIKDEPTGAQLCSLSPVDLSQEILRRKSWDAEATPEEIVATESLGLRIKSLQNTPGQELSGVQILAYFLRVRVQPLQARATPLWMYFGTGDSARISADLPVGELEKLVRRFTSLTKNDVVPTTCRVEPFSAAHPIPPNHQILSQLPSLPEGGEVVEQFIIDDESQDASARAAEPAGTKKSVGSSDKLTESASVSDSSFTHSVPPAASPEGRKTKRSDGENSGESKFSEPVAEETATDFDPFGVAATPLVKEMIELGTRFAGYRIEAENLRGELLHAQEHIKELEQRLEASDKAHRDAKTKIEAAEAKAATADDLRVRLNDAETTLSKKEEQVSRRESAVVARLETQSNRFLKKIGEMYTQNQGTDEDALLDALSVLEMNCSLARDCLKYGRAALERIFPHFFPKAVIPEKFEPLAKSFLEKEDPVLAHRHASLKIGVEGTIALVMASGEKVDWAKAAAVRGLNKNSWTTLLKSAKAYSKKFLAFLDPSSSSTTSTAQPEVM
ncbi:hypothetical protein QYE76_008803 [Lolium multiflorum]|uniref:Transposase (putative) gypsy type domain-containing protein n=1 Tax=Lolium multiflorum TaxID=4521 RepID=A0AAD8TQS4_LOLMU|nr:hypothetical protein QYE76_008803 [Lolium multiflorum]